MTATKAPAKKKADPVAELAAAEAELAQAQQATQEAARDHLAIAERFGQLQEQRAKLIEEQPALVDHNLAPVGKEDDPNPVREIDVDIGQNMPQEAEAKVAHAQRHQRAAEQQRDEIVRIHGEAIDEARREEGDQLAAAYSARLADVIAAGERLVDYGRRSMHLAGIRRIDTQQIPIEHVANQLFTVRELIDHPPPIPRLPDPIEEEEP